MRHLRPVLTSLSLLAAAAAGCTDDALPADDLVAVEDGKADDYYSNVSLEFEARGSVRVKMTAAEYADAAQRKAIVERRLTAVGLYLTAYVTDKFEGLDINRDGRISEDEVFFRNDGYGGFHAMVRTQSGEAGILSRVAGAVDTYDLRFELDLAGPPNLMQLLPRVGTTAPFTFELKMPEGATVDPTNVPRGAIRNWKPETATGPVETHRLALVRLPTPKNAYLQYGEFVKDGVYDITMVFGHDYNTPRADLQEAEETFQHLVARGFRAPVARFAELKATSGPFTLAAQAGGRDVQVEVRLFHADMFTTDRPGQKALVLGELVKRDVFFYNGHAGPYYGLYLDAAHAADIGYLEVANAPFTDKQQLVVAQGCQTYSQYSDMLYASPTKSEANLDVITTVNYSYGAGTLELFDGLTAFEGTAHRPTDAYALIEQLNAQWINQSYEVFYGITGITANPGVHPYAALDKLGATCATASDCGDPAANLCIKKRVDSRTKVCAATAVAPRCPTGTFFKQLREGATIVAAACVK